jgi:farnesyl diphosphate synthase
VSARDPGTDGKMPDSLIIDNVVTFLMVGQETTAQALTWTLYLLALRIKAALELSDAGLMMIQGLVHDMHQDLEEGRPAEEARLLRCYRLKSASLYGAAAKMGGILTGADDAEAASLEAAGIDLGYSYQFLDDVADVEAGVAEVGKEQGKDAAKCTAVDLFGVEGARAKALEFQARSLAHLERFGAEADWLRNLVCEASWKAS